MASNFGKTCFVMMRFGTAGSAVRKESDYTYQHIIKKAVKDSGLALECVRADEIKRPGEFAKEASEYATRCKVAVADLTDDEGNVAYELGMRRHASQPTILIAKKGTELPAMLRHERVIFYCVDTKESRELARRDIIDYLHFVCPGRTDRKSSAARKSSQAGSSSNSNEPGSRSKRAKERPTTGTGASAKKQAKQRGTSKSRTAVEPGSQVSRSAPQKEQSSSERQNTAKTDENCAWSSYGDLYLLSDGLRAEIRNTQKACSERFEETVSEVSEYLEKNGFKRDRWHEDHRYDRWRRGNSYVDVYNPSHWWSVDCDTSWLDDWSGVEYYHIQYDVTPYLERRGHYPSADGSVGGWPQYDDYRTSRDFERSLINEASWIELLRGRHRRDNRLMLAFPIWKDHHQEELLADVIKREIESHCDRAVPTFLDIFRDGLGNFLQEDRLIIQPVRVEDLDEVFGKF